MSDEDLHLDSLTSPYHACSGCSASGCRSQKSLSVLREMILIFIKYHDPDLGSIEFLGTFSLSPGGTHKNRKGIPGSSDWPKKSTQPNRSTDQRGCRTCGDLWVSLRPVRRIFSSQSIRRNRCGIQAWIIAGRQFISPLHKVVDFMPLEIVHEMLASCRVRFTHHFS